MTTPEQRARLGEGAGILIKNTPSRTYEHGDACDHIVVQRWKITQERVEKWGDDNRYEGTSTLGGIRFSSEEELRQFIIACCKGYEFIATSETQLMTLTEEIVRALSGQGDG